MIPRYTLPEMAAVWSDQARLSHWLRIEVLACEAWARLGRIPEPDLTAIRTRASFSIERVVELERTTNHDVAARVRAQVVVDDRAVGRILPGWLVGRQRRVGVLTPAKAIRGRRFE